jgi:hypothetical protein
MLVYLRKQAGPPEVPPWLDGWKAPAEHLALCHRDSDAGHMVGAGDPLLMCQPAKWKTLSADWLVGETERTVNAGILTRDQLWCDIEVVADLKETPWVAPRILNKAGGRAFRVAYGADWLPALSDEQARAEKIALAAREALLSAGSVDMPIACQWAAELLCVTYHLHPQVFAAFALLDDRLVPEVLGAAAGLDLAATVPNDG